MEGEDFFFGRDRLQLSLLECQLTYRCNIRCDYCFNPHHKKVVELGTDEWKQVIQEVRELGATVCIFTGGEPTLRQDCVELIGYAHSNGLRTAISTNGLLLTPDRLHLLAPVLDVLQISIHPWRYRADLKSGVQQFSEKVATFKRYGGRSAVFNIVLSKGLVTHLDELLKLISDSAGDHLDQVGVQAAHPYGYGYINLNAIPSLSECEEASTIINKCQKELRVKIQNTVAHYFKVKPNTWGAYGVIINPAGYVLPLIEGADSLSYLFNQLEFDNIQRRKLQDIWVHSDVLSAFRGTEWHQEPCLSCELRETCRGGSRLNAFIVTKDMYKTDPFCIKSPDHHKVLHLYRQEKLEFV